MLQAQDLVDEGTFLVRLSELVARLLDLSNHLSRLFKLQSQLLDQIILCLHLFGGCRVQLVFLHLQNLL